MDVKFLEKLKFRFIMELENKDYSGLTIKIKDETRILRSG
jgi:hypothetical protein